MVELIVGNFIEPWLCGSNPRISSLALLVTAVFWTILWGPPVLSFPRHSVYVVVLGRYVPQLSFFHVLLADEAVLAAEAQQYQRLLAMDQQEARSVVDVILKFRTLIELYDLIFIPALSLAEQDRHSGAIDTARDDSYFSVSLAPEARITEAIPEVRRAATYEYFVAGPRRGG
jgi:hypothetical protein